MPLTNGGEQRGRYHSLLHPHDYSLLGSGAVPEASRHENHLRSTVHETGDSLYLEAQFMRLETSIVKVTEGSS